MAAKLNLDDVSGSEIVQTGLAVRLTRGFTVTDMDAAATSDPSLMVTARDLALAGAGASYPGRPDYILSGIIIRGITHNGFEGQLVYETFSGLEPSVFIVRDAQYTETRRVVYSPASGDLLQVDSKDGSGNVVIPEDIVHYELDWPMRAISVTATRFGRPPTGLGRGVPSVNDSSWPLEDPYDKGFWKVVGLVSVTNRIRGYYTYSATAITRTSDPWADLIVLRSNITGKFAKVDPALFKTTFAKPYSFGVDRQNGFLRICPYPEVNIASLLPI